MTVITVLLLIILTSAAALGLLLAATDVPSLRDADDDEPE